eukprot:2740861-Prymnesium_polylepis.1
MEVQAIALVTGCRYSCTAKLHGGMRATAAEQVKRERILRKRIESRRLSSSAVTTYPRATISPTNSRGGYPGLRGNSLSSLVLLSTSRDSSC